MAEAHTDVDAILMASGLSRRFGKEDKLLAPFLGKPLFLHTLTLFTSFPGFHRVFVTLANPAVEQLAKPYPVTVLHNQNPQRGGCESVRLGVMASLADFYLFATCDQPLLNADTLHRLLGARQAGKIVQPVFKGVPGSPVLFAASFRQELLALQDGEAPRCILQRHKEALVPVQLPSALPLMDVDHPEDLRKLEELI